MVITVTRNQYVQIDTGIPEKVIAETLGHKSSKALWWFLAHSIIQQQAVLAAINNTILYPVALSCSCKLLFA